MTIPPDTIKQRGTQLGLECGDALADRWLRQVQGVCGSGKRRVFRNQQEGAEVLCVHGYEPSN